MRRLRFDFYGTSVRLASESAEVLDALRRDFAYFESSGPERADIGLTLAVGRFPGGRRGLPLFRARDYRVFDSARGRAILYEDGAAAVHDFSRERGRVWAASAERLHELGYLAVLSRVGEALDRRGLHRVHALGIVSAGRAALLLLPEGGGKSTLALEIWRASRAGFLSEDTPLIDRRGRVLAFPLRWGFRDSADLGDVPTAMIRPFSRRRRAAKRLVDVGFFAERIVPQAPLRWLIVGRRGRRDRLAAAGRAETAGALATSLVAGVGVPQMSEYLLRPGAAGGLAGVAWSRARAAAGLLGARRVAFELGGDPRRSARALLSFLETEAFPG